ncbi:FunK1 protein kinase [Nannizzia gypsea CBS 118893]|uniref:FunK1 protein kinase n=1 Tax=Arthroderma gypseum (strain ATCC MYA-4604 / CBS 118893) TaxID=535722 RepID=E4V0P7_ARTGP|nr:FunK1 protein kinase [Nannizzia gypsea CBS 118893]EFR03184.1 FunK1 protein kinase [Nannizzia gypsea CBS 118893]
MSPSRSEIINSHPIGDRLDEFHDLYSICQSLFVPTLTDESAHGSDIKTRVFNFIIAFTTLPACHQLPSTKRSGALYLDLFQLAANFEIIPLLPNNLMINEDKESVSWRAFIIDMDLAIKEDREDISGARTIGVLLDEQHSFMHDLESFFWVLFWICIHYEGPRKGRVVKDYDEWNYMSTEKLAKVKVGTVDEAIFMRTISANFTPYYEPLIPHVNRLRREVFPADKPWRKEDIGLYSRMKKVLRDAQADPAVLEIL